jgi:hypothetical protein
MTDIITRARYLADRLDGYDAEVVTELVTEVERLRAVTDIIDPDSVYREQRDEARTEAETLRHALAQSQSNHMVEETKLRSELGTAYSDLDTARATIREVEKLRASLPPDAEPSPYASGIDRALTGEA